jgi:hypothetical protein
MWNHKFVLHIGWEPLIPPSSLLSLLSRHLPSPLLLPLLRLFQPLPLPQPPPLPQPRLWLPVLPLLPLLPRLLFLPNPMLIFIDCCLPPPLSLLMLTPPPTGFSRRCCGRQPPSKLIVMIFFVLAIATFAVIVDIAPVAIFIDNTMPGPHYSLCCRSLPSLPSHCILRHHCCRCLRRPAAAASVRGCTGEF